MTKRYRGHKADRCIDCGVNTSTIGEYYVVNDEVWTQAFGKPDQHGMLCIGCLEARLHRRLLPSDFRPCPANFFNGKSPRLLSRLWGEQWRREMAKARTPRHRPNSIGTNGPVILQRSCSVRARPERAGGALRRFHDNARSASIQPKAGTPRDAYLHRGAAKRYS
jgi:hypothetical protein